MAVPAIRGYAGGEAFRLASLGREEVPAVMPAHAVRKPGMAAVRGLATLHKLEDDDVTDVQLRLAIECDSPLAQVGAGAEIGLFHQQPATQDSHRNPEGNTFAVAAVKAGWQFGKDSVFLDACIFHAALPPVRVLKTACQQIHRQTIGKSSGAKPHCLRASRFGPVPGWVHPLCRSISSPALQ